MHCLTQLSPPHTHYYSPVLPAVQLQFKQRLCFLWVALQTPHDCGRVRVHKEPNSTITGSEGTTAAQRLTHDCALSLSSRSEASRNPASHVLLKEAERRRERTLTSARAAEECKWENVEAPLLIEPFREREREREREIVLFKHSSASLTIKGLWFMWNTHAHSFSGL